MSSLLLLLPGIAGPAFAGTVYIPIPDPGGLNGSASSVKIWLSNAGTAQATVANTFLEADTDGTQRTSPGTPSTLAPGQTILFSGSGIAGKVGLLEISSSADVAINARLTTLGKGGLFAYSELPVISSANLFASGKTATVQGLGRDSLTGDVSGLGIVNLAQQAAQCTAKVFRADGSQIASAVSLALKPLSFLYFADTLGILNELSAVDVRIQVTCNQPFYLYGTFFSGATSQLLFLTPASSGSTLTAPSGATPPPSTPPPSPPPPPPPPPTTPPPTTPPPTPTPTVIGNVFQVQGLFHTPTVGHEKKQYLIGLDRAITSKKVVVDLDVIPGPWNTAKQNANHALIWLYRGKFRSNTIANVNAFGPPRISLKMNENLDLPAGGVAAKEVPVPWEKGTLYHLHYVYDFTANSISCDLTSGGKTVKSMAMNGTSKQKTVTIPTQGMTVEFGHYANQSGPEVASYGWQYLNLRIEFVPQ
ncbi:MAG TPA: hypothetical protein VLX28_03280 [Thermoanaerobaculia bacterium]|nr:hypothetical protein [Thermoanaerobaculia bacterium]